MQKMKPCFVKCPWSYFDNKMFELYVIYWFNAGHPLNVYPKLEQYSNNLTFQIKTFSFSLIESTHSI